MSCDEKTFDNYKNLICNSGPFFNENEINYINNFMNKTIKPLRNDVIFKSILTKVSDQILDNTKRLCSYSKITCNF